MGFSISKIVLTSVVGLLAASFLKDAFAEGLGTTLGKVGVGGQAIGGALSSTGQGLQGLLTGIGTGTANLLYPLFTLKELAGPVMGVASGGTGESGQQEVDSSTTQTINDRFNNLMEITSAVTTGGVTTFRNRFGTLTGPTYGGFASAEQQAQETSRLIQAGAQNPNTAHWFDTPFYKSLGF